MVLFATGSLRAETNIEFTAAFSTTEATKLSLADKTTGLSRWVEIGSSFAGYRVTAYDAKSETVTLEKPDGQLQLRLITAKVREGSTAIRPLTLSQARTIYIHLAQLVAATQQYCKETGKPSATFDELVGPANMVKAVSPVAGENYRNLRFEMKTELLSIQTASGETITFDANNTSTSTSTFRAIQPGDTLATIARSAGLTVGQLAIMNEITDPAKLSAGTILRVR